MGGVKGGLRNTAISGRGVTHLLMLPHEVLDMSVLALLSLMNLLLAPQLSIVPQRLQPPRKKSKGFASFNQPTRHAEWTPWPPRDHTTQALTSGQIACWMKRKRRVYPASHFTMGACVLRGTSRGGGVGAVDQRGDASACVVRV